MKSPGRHPRFAYKYLHAAILGGPLVYLLGTAFKFSALALGAMTTGILMLVAAWESVAMRRL